jgi:aspartyl-tRNA(Asn)/glutamyl-tRNA(Gln) amidotransferase subunit A
VTAPPRGVVALAKAYAQGLDPVEAVEAYLERIDRLDGAINAFVALDRVGARAAAAASAARRRAGKALGPLDGVPIGVKDNIDVGGLPTTAGIAHYAKAVPRADAPCVARLRAAGAIILGKLNMHEGALGATNDNASLGRCHNPWRHGFTPGGSSGGSGAAVAAGLCAAALGTDTLGSVRVPASYCGIAAIKPSRGVVPTDGVVPLSWSLDHVGVLAPAVGDLEPVLAAIAGFDHASADSIAPPPGWLSPPRPGKLRIGRVASLHDYPLEAPVRAAQQAALDKLAVEGAEIVEVALDADDFTRLRRQGLLIAEIEAHLVHGAAIEHDPDGFSEDFRAALAYAARQPAARIAAAYRALHEAAHFLREAVAGTDALLLPTTPQVAFPFEAPVPASQADLTGLANMAGLPAVAVPVGSEPGGLPLSMQVVAGSHAEGRALAIAARIEAVLAPPM